MPITANLIPSQVPHYAHPYDATTAFANAQVIAATGYANNVNAVLDLGSANPSSAAGRTNFMWVINVTNLKVSANDESYRFALFGSNDAAFGNGNVELLMMFDAAAVTAGRLVTTILGPSPIFAVPPPGRAGLQYEKACSNLHADVVFRYLKCYVVVGGTGPTTTLSSWISRSDADF